MRVIVFSTKNFEKPFLEAALGSPLEILFTDKALALPTTFLASGCQAACIFTNDDASATVLTALHKLGIRYLAVRAAGYDNVDLNTANKLGIHVANVPEYSPYAIAEHAVALILSLNRKLLLANELVHRQDFTLDHLVGFDLHNKFVAIIGTGRIGKVMAKILDGFGCKLLAYDLNPDHNLEQAFDVQYGSLRDVCSKADIISIHVPLSKETHHLINRELITVMRRGVMLVNTSRGAVLHTEDCIEFLENGHIGYLGLDVYEKEKGVFFYDHSKNPIQDPILLKLLGFTNVLMTPHQGFATIDALQNIADTTFYNINCWRQHNPSENELTGYPLLSNESTMQSKNCWDTITKFEGV